MAYNKQILRYKIEIHFQYTIYIVLYLVLNFNAFSEILAYCLNNNPHKLCDYTVGYKILM